MTSEKGKDIPGPVGGEQRPHITLDLQATEVGETGAQRTPEPPAANETAEQTAGEESAARQPALEAPATDHAAEQPASGGGLLTHIAAGALGALLALSVGYAALRAMDDTVTGAADAETQSLRAALAAADGRIAALERSAASPGSQPDPALQSLQGEIGALKRDLAALASRQQRAESQPAPLSEASADSLRQSLAPTEAKVSALEDRVGALAKTQDEFRAAAEAAALSHASENLRRAIADGRPFTAELAAVKAFAPAGLDLKALDARSAAGVASLASLQRGFGPAVKAALDAARPPSDGSFGSELLAKARSLVRVRPKGDIPGPAPEAILARAERSLTAGDIAQAARETAQLQGPAADVMKPWLAEANARAAADDALRQIEAKLLTSLAADERLRKGS